MTNETLEKINKRVLLIHSINRKMRKWFSILALLLAVIVIAFILTIAAAVIWMSRIFTFIAVAELLLGVVVALIWVITVWGLKGLNKEIRNGKHDDKLI